MAPGRIFSLHSTKATSLAVRPPTFFNAPPTPDMAPARAGPAAAVTFVSPSDALEVAEEAASLAFAAVSCAVDECLIAGRRITVRDCRINIRDIVADMVEGEERRVCRVVNIETGQAMRDPSSARELSMADAGCVGDGEVVGVAFFFVFKFRVFPGPKGKSRDTTFAQAKLRTLQQHHLSTSTQPRLQPRRVHVRSLEAWTLMMTALTATG